MKYKVIRTIALVMYISILILNCSTQKQTKPQTVKKTIEKVSKKKPKLCSDLNAILISDYSDFNNIRNNLKASYCITKDISFPENQTFIPIGDNKKPFSGKIDGNFHSISKINIVVGGGSNVGVVSILGVGGSIRNLKVNLKKIAGSRWVGGLVGTNYGLIESVSVVGGLVEADKYGVGGLVGRNGSYKLKRGELVGPKGNIKRCYTDVLVYSKRVVGGIAGSFLSGDISDSYSVGEVSVKENGVYVGGLTGYALKGNINKSYTISKIKIGDRLNTGILSGSYVKTKSCYYDKQDDKLSFVGKEYQSPKGTRGISSQRAISSQKVFKDWDFNKTWHFSKGQWPKLQWANTKNNTNQSTKEK